MRKVAVLILAVLCSGCTMYNAWIVKGNGKDLKGKYQVAGAQASNADMIFARSLLFTTQKVNKEFLESLPAVRASMDKDSDIKNVEIGR